MDIFNGLDDNTVEQRYDAWMNYLIGNEKGFPVFETKRNGLVVPFYPLLINQKKEK